MDARAVVNVFVVNAGSSSIKAAAFAGDAWRERSLEPAWSCEVRWTTLPARAKLVWSTPTSHGEAEVAVDDHGSGVAEIVRIARETVDLRPAVVGHRVVHGGDEREPARIDERVRDAIEAAADLAPAHNRAALAGIDACTAAFPDALQAAEFDTAFHATMPPEAAAFALPYAWFAERGLRRYGFHGISHGWCARRTAELLGVDPHGLRLVSAHLGNGASLAAIVSGASVDTTMGFTPLDGLMMGTRSGSVDPGLVLYLLRTGASTVEELDRTLNHDSGLLGVSTISSDVRDVAAAAERGVASAALALDMFVHRVSASIAAMAASAGGIDALAFTGGIGEHSALVRGRVCSRLRFLGVALDAERDAGNGDREIGAADAAVRTVVVRAREELAVARAVARFARVNL